MGRWISQLIDTDYAALARIAAQGNRNESLELLLETDVVIDFSSPEASVRLAELALQHPTGKLPVFIVGSTGWKDEQIKTLEALAKRTPVVLSFNFSTGVLALQRILKTFAPVLTQLGYQPVMVETHHRHKKDAPSGTALLLNRTIETSAGIGPVQTHSIRSGEVIGDHEVTFYGPADRLVLGHQAQDRSIFARGAIDAAIWAHQKRNELATEKSILSMDRYFDDLISKA
jgi:4-hydroxy-tetrahydrodipicolinate reductase